MTHHPTGVGIIGAGVISAIYLHNLTTSARWNHLRVVAIADLLPDRAHARADEFGIDALSVDDLLAHPDIDIVLNLTIPAAHATVCEQVMASGKSVYTEKPLALTRDEAARILATARDNGLVVGCAPDTFLGASLQTARRLIDDGTIGEPVAFRGHMITRGHELWHPDPAFLYQPGAGPMLDMGPYYLTALTTLLGPVARVASMARASFPARTVATGPKAGETFEVTTPSHIEALLELRSGVTGSLTTTFDLWDPSHSHLVIYGSEGSLRLPDPNTFGGSIQLLRGGETAWEDVPLDPGYTTNSRGVGLADLATALQTGEPPRASGDLGYHVLDVMLATLDDAEQGRHLDITSTIDRPAPLGPIDPHDLAAPAYTYPGETLGT